MGKCFLRRLYNANVGIKAPHHSVHITQEFLTWFNGVTLIRPRPTLSSEDIHLYTDSCKTGYGGTLERDYIHEYFSVHWLQYSIK